MSYDAAMPAGQPDRSLGPELRAPTRYSDGSTDETSEALDVIADALAAVPASVVNGRCTLCGATEYVEGCGGANPRCWVHEESAGPGGGTGTGPAQPTDSPDG